MSKLGTKPRPNLYLTGFMGAGKSSVGKRLARKLGWTFVDTDRLIETRAKMKVAQIIGKKGESAFRNLESDALKTITRKRQHVVALGGGTLTRPQSRAQILRSGGKIIYLKAYATTLNRRLSTDAPRPLLLGKKRSARLHLIRNLIQARRSIYEKADFTLRTDQMNPSEVANAIYKRMAF